MRFTCAKASVSLMALYAYDLKPASRAKYLPGGSVETQIPTSRLSLIGGAVFSTHPTLAELAGGVVRHPRGRRHGSERDSRPESP
jgi:hypothetical protein